MGKNGKRSGKVQRAKVPVKGLPVNDLPMNDATGVKGGRAATLTIRKAGGTQQE